VLANQADRFLKKAEQTLAGRITEKLKDLRFCPIPSDAKRLFNSRLWRIRVGDYRILYEVDFDRKTIGIEKIDHRSRVYD
jgi:mRNA interferase RelE/StbE